MNKLVAILALTTLLVGCPKDWSAEDQRLAQSEDWVACHFDNDEGDIDLHLLDSSGASVAFSTSISDDESGLPAFMVSRRADRVAESLKHG